MNSTQACDRCHRRKTRCDKARPECGPCGRAGASCLYSERIREPLVRRDIVDKLERRVSQLEAKNRSLRERLAARREDVTEQPQDVLSPISTETSVVEDPEGQQRSAADDVANEVSFLSTSAGGDRQFLGSASGLLFASLVRASITGAKHDGTLSPRSAREAAAGSNGIAGRLDWGIDDRELPPRQLSKSLVEAYLAHDHICFPFLLPLSVRATVDSIYRDPSRYGSQPFEAFVFNMLLAIATSQIHKFNWQALPDAETHHLKATVHLDAVLRGGGVKALQAMLLLCQFRLSSSTKDASGSLWHLVGISVRMCLELGLHRESTYQLKQAPDSVLVGSPTAFEDQEVRRRCFWSVFALDRIVSITLGRPLAICLEDIDVELPRVDISLPDTSPSVPSPRDVYSPDFVLSPSRTAIFVHIVRYRRLCGKALTSLHRGSRPAANHDNNLSQARNELVAELEEWRSDTAALNLPEMDLTTPIAEARSSFRSKAWYELLYHNGVLLLYRPSSAAGSSSSDASSLQRMFTSAKQAITLYSYLFRSRKINFSWNTLHASFMAGLSYVYAVSRHIRERRRQQVAGVSRPSTTLAQEPTVMELVNDCRACSNILVAVSERCNAQKSCHEVFDRLSDAILADVVELLSTSATAKCREQNHGRTTPPAIREAAHHTGINHVLNPVSQPDMGLQSRDINGPRHAQVVIENSERSYMPYHATSEQIHIEPVLAADNALRDCFPDLQRMYDTQWGDDAILQLGIDWLEEIDTGNSASIIGEPMDTTYSL